MKPFEQLDYRDLPEVPRRPHGFHALETRTVRVPSRVFGDMNVHVGVAGSGPPLLLLHGLMTSSYSFRYVVEPLATRFRVYVPDLPGAGRSDAPRGRYGAPELSASIGELVDALGIRGATCIANSMAGYLAMRLVLDDEKIFSRLVNVHSPVLPSLKLWALKTALSLPLSRTVLDRMVAHNPRRWVHRHVHYFDETLKSYEEAREYAAPLDRGPGRAAFASWLGDGLDPRDLAAFAESLRRRRDGGVPFPVPLLLLYARTDPMVPPEMGDRLAELVPDARLAWLEESSHFAHVDTPEPFLRVVLPFIAP